MCKEVFDLTVQYITDTNNEAKVRHNFELLIETIEEFADDLELVLSDAEVLATAKAVFNHFVN